MSYLKEMNVCIVAGARPNFIKVSSLLRAIDHARSQGKDIDSCLVYAGSENDPDLEPTLFDDLQMRRPDVCLGVVADNLNELTGQVMSAFESYLQTHHTDVVIVVDDLASTMAASIVAKKRGLPLAHLVAGTRSFDITMPKEINRLVIDGLSDLLFTAGIGANSAVTREGAEGSKVFMVGNILMDTLRHSCTRWRRPSLLDGLSLSEGGYIVLTLNRKALLEDKSRLAALLECVVRNVAGTPVVAPLRGLAAEVAGAIKDSDPQLFAPLHLVGPLPYLEFCYLAAHAKGIVTDSGNVAEEATFNQVPCITLNRYTEHQETVKIGTNVLVGEDPEKLAAAVRNMAGGEWKQSAIPERWDGRSSERVVQILLDRFGDQ